MKIGIDIDEVVAGYLEGFCNFYNNTYGGESSLDDFKEFSVSKTFNVSPEESYRLRKEFHDSDFFDNINFIDEAKEAIDFLGENNDLIFITARQSYQKEKTIGFFERHFPENLFEIIFSGEYSEGKFPGEYSEGKTKDEICQEIGVDVLIEDSEHSQDYAEKGLKVILIDKPWNKGFEHENIHRVNNWSEVLEKIKEINGGVEK